MVTPDIALPEHPQPAPPAEKASGANAAATEAPARTLKAIEFRQEKTPEEKVGIRKKTEDEYKVFLNNYLTNISRAVDQNPSLRTSDAAKLGVQLLDKLTTDGKLDTTKIDSFLNEERGWMVATEALNEYVLQLNAVMGFSAETKPQSERGKLMKAAKSRIEGVRWLGNLGKSENPFGAKFIDFKTETDLFTTLKNDPQQKAYIKAVIGIDLDDWQVNTAQNKIEKNPLRFNPDNRTPESLREQTLLIMQARRDFLTDLGIPLKQIESIPEEALLTKRATDEGFAQTGLKWEKEIIGMFKQNQLLVINAANRPLNLLEFNKARREIMLRYISELEIQEAIKHPSTTKSGVEQRLANITQEKTRLTQEQEDKKTSLVADKQEIATSQVNLTDVETKRTSLKNIDRQIQVDHGIPIASIQTAIDNLKLELSPTGTFQSQLDNTRTTKDSYETNTRDTLFKAVTTAGRTLSAAEATRLIEQARERADQKYAPVIADITEQREAAKSKLTALNTISAQYKSAQTELTQAENMAVSKIPKNLIEVKSNYERFINAAGATISSPQLETQTIDQLISLAIAPPYSIPNATPDEQKALRQMLLHAKTEYKATRVETYDPSSQTQQDSFNLLMSFTLGTISTNSLLTEPEQQLTFKLSSPPYNLSAQDIKDNLPLAIAEAKRKLIIRYKIGVEERLSDLENQMQIQTELIKITDKDIDKKKENLIMTKVVQERQGEIYKQALKIPYDTSKYTDSSTVTAGNTEYSQAEINVGAEKAYYEMLNLLFDYRQGKEIDSVKITREEYFKRIYEFLPPPELLVLVAEAIGFQGPHPIYATPLDMLASSSNTEIAHAFTKMVNKLGEKAIAL